MCELLVVVVIVVEYMTVTSKYKIGYYNSTVVLETWKLPTTLVEQL